VSGIRVVPGFGGTILRLNTPATAHGRRSGLISRWQRERFATAGRRSSAGRPTASRSDLTMGFERAGQTSRWALARHSAKGAFPRAHPLGHADRPAHPGPELPGWRDDG
jgi:hypothetical protein